MEKKTSKNILLAIMGVLILLELFAAIASFSSLNFIASSCAIVALLFVALYGFWLYKKPHGNMLKYSMIILAASIIVNAAKCIQMNYNPLYIHITRLLSAAMITYIAGRLNRIEKNKYLFVIGVVALFVVDFMGIIPNIGSEYFTFFVFLRFVYDAVTLLTLMIAYFVRYKEHKEAGLMDAPKKST